jgi:hypothetical protein
MKLRKYAQFALIYASPIIPLVGFADGTTVRVIGLPNALENLVMIASMLLPRRLVARITT